MNRAKSVLSFGGETFVRGKDGDKIWLEEVMKGKSSLGIRNCNNVITSIYWSFNMDKAFYCPIPSSLSTL